MVLGQKYKMLNLFGVLLFHPIINFNVQGISYILRDLDYMASQIVLICLISPMRSIGHSLSRPNSRFSLIITTVGFFKLKMQHKLH